MAVADREAFSLSPRKASRSTLAPRDVSRERVVAPATSQRLDELHRRHQALTRELRGGALRDEHRALTVDDVDVADVAGIESCLRELGRAARRSERALDGVTLLRQEPRRRQRVLHFLERDEHALAVRGDAFLERRARAAQVRLVAAALEDRQRDARTDAPDPALQVEEV